MRNEEVQTNGLTPVENERFYDLLKKKKDVGRLSQDEWAELRGYFDKRDTYGLSAEVMADRRKSLAFTNVGGLCLAEVP